MICRVVERSIRDMLGEGPVWLAERGELLWVDIVAPAIHRLHLGTGKISTTSMPEPVGWALPIAGSRDFMVGLKSGFWRMDLDGDARIHLANPETDRPQNRLNDAKVDPSGRIWAGSKDDSDSQHSGALYRLDADMHHVRVDDGYGVTNGPAFSPDGSILYHTDSARREIYAFDLDADGTLSGKRVWVRFEEDWGYPDGMTTDSDGCVWVAHWAGAQISRFDPDGNRMSSFQFPASNITSCAFAGADLDRMFVTSSKIDAENEELAGALFEIDPGVRGLPSASFIFSA